MRAEARAVLLTARLTVRLRLSAELKSQNELTPAVLPATERPTAQVLSGRNLLPSHRLDKATHTIAGCGTIQVGPQRTPGCSWTISLTSQTTEPTIFQRLIGHTEVIWP